MVIGDHISTDTGVLYGRDATRAVDTRKGRGPKKTKNIAEFDRIRC